MLVMERDQKKNVGGGKKEEDTAAEQGTGQACCRAVNQSNKVL